MQPTGIDLCYLRLSEAAGLLGRRELSPVEITRAFLERIERLDGLLHAYITVTAERALADAQAAEAALARGESRGPLHGIPIALKDLFLTQGIRTTGHSRLLADNIPSEDATVVARLRDAGTILLGKLAMHEFAFAGPAGDLAPAARNPWDTERIPGGSSSGSGAAVAAGLCAAALGSDTGGSIRNPSAYCGVVGVKPTYGRVSRQGVLPLSWSLDHVGPMARTVEDAALLLQAMAGHDPGDPTTSTAPVPDYAAALTGDIRGLRVGLPPLYFDRDRGTYPEVLEAVERALDELRSLGAEVQSVEIPHLSYARAAQQVIMVTEAYAYHADNLRRHPEKYGNLFRRRVQVAALTGADHYLRALRVRTLLRAEFARAMERVDVLVCPTVPRPAPLFSEEDPVPMERSFTFRGPFNLVGLPVVAVPCGFTPEGLPMGMQVVGRPFDEATALRVAHAYERRAGWYQRRPPVD